MGRTPCCHRNDVRRGPWSPEEDAALRNYMRENLGNGGSWIALPARAGLKRCGKSCRLRWMNYLRPYIKHGGFTKEEDEVICALYLSIGSRWSVIASKLPGRTDNDIKNYWNTKLKKKMITAALAANLCAPDCNPLQPSENDRQSSFGKDTSLDMVSVSVAATESDFDNINNASDLRALSSERFHDNRLLTLGEEEEALLDFGGNDFFSNFGYLDWM